jgi:CRISPR-associated protein Csb2
MYFHVEFTKGRFHGSNSKNKEDVEWPPSPFRFYSALVKAHYSLKNDVGDESKQGCVASLEKLPPPIIFTPPVVLKPILKGGDKGVIRTWGKANGPDVKPSSDCRGGKNVFKQDHFIVVNEVYFYWEGADQENIQHLLARINWLGTSASTVKVWIKKPTGEFDMWEPADNSRQHLRCPRPGTFRDLDIKHETGLEAKPLLQPYLCRRVRVVDGVVEERPKQVAIWEKTYYFGLQPQGPRPVLLNAMAIADGMRTAIGKKAKELGLGAFEEEVFSHIDKDHLSYFPLPYVFGEYPTGDIKGVAVSLPKSLASWHDDLHLCLYHLKEIPFLVGERNYGTLLVVPPTSGVTLNSNSWERASFTWESITPIEMIVTKANEGEKKLEWIRQQCQWHGLPKPTKIEFPWRPDWNGNKPIAHDFGEPYIKTKGRKPWFLTYLKLTFPIPVRGPILFGKSKNCGMGIMCPTDPY